jgi:hypothetical protein
MGERGAKRLGVAHCSMGDVNGTGTKSEPHRLVRYTCQAEFC